MTSLALLRFSNRKYSSGLFVFRINPLFRASGSSVYVPSWSISSQSSHPSISRSMTLKLTGMIPPLNVPLQ